MSGGPLQPFINLTTKKMCTLYELFYKNSDTHNIL